MKLLHWNIEKKGNNLQIKKQNLKRRHGRRGMTDANKIMKCGSSVSRKSCSLRSGRFSYNQKGVVRVWENITTPLEDSNELLLHLKQCRNLPSPLQLACFFKDLSCL